MQTMDQGALVRLLQETIEYLKKDNERLRKENAELLAKVSDLLEKTSNLQESVDYLTRKLYGKSKESTPDPNQMSLFNEAEVTADPNVPEPTKEEVVAGYIRKGKKSRSSMFKDVPIEEVVCYVSDDERNCPLCYTEMEVIGKRFVREELQIIPAQVKRIHYYQEVLACPKCKKEDEEFVTVSALTPTPLIKGASLASPSSVGWVMYQKCAMGQTFYRMEQDWIQNGVKLLRGTMASWMITCSLNYLQPVYERLHEYLLQRDIIHADEVPCQVLREPGRPAQAKSYMWVYLTGNDGEPGIVLYDYHPGRKGEYARDFLKGFHGYCHCDGYSGYNTPEDIKRVGCYAHLRRKFFDAIPKRKEAGSEMLPAEVGVHYCDQLFRLEREYKDQTASARKKLRLEKEKPIIDEFYKWVNDLNPVKGSKLAAAVTYAKNQRQNLMNYFEDGRLELSNNAAERRVKSYVIGRKNFLFHTSVDGAKASAIVYSMVETAKINDLNIYEYLRTLLLYMPDYKNEPEGIEDMMPWSDFIKKRCSKVMHIEKEMEPKKR